MPLPANGKLVLGGLALMIAVLLTASALGRDLGLPTCLAALAITAAGALVTSFVVGVGNNLVNNLPLGLIAGATLQVTHTHGLIANAVLIGVDLGPNLPVTGPLATILWLIALRREKLDVSFWGFLRVGIIAMPVALFASMGGAILLQALFKVV